MCNMAKLTVVAFLALCVLQLASAASVDKSKDVEGRRLGAPWLQWIQSLRPQNPPPPNQASGNRNKRHIPTGLASNANARSPGGHPGGQPGGFHGPQPGSMHGPQPNPMHGPQPSSMHGPQPAGMHGPQPGSMHGPPGGLPGGFGGPQPFPGSSIGGQSFPSSQSLSGPGGFHSSHHGGPQPLGGPKPPGAPQPSAFGPQPAAAPQPSQSLAHLFSADLFTPTAYQAPQPSSQSPSSLSKQQMYNAQPSFNSFQSTPYGAPTSQFGGPAQNQRIASAPMGVASYNQPMQQQQYGGIGTTMNTSMRF